MGNFIFKDGKWKSVQRIIEDKKNKEDKLKITMIEKPTKKKRATRSKKK